MIDRVAGVVCLIALIAAPLAAKDSLGVFESWAAFRDVQPGRCYAIARPERAERKSSAFVSVADWPGEGVRGQVHFRLSQDVANSAQTRLAVGMARFELKAEGRNAWAQDAAMDAAILAAMRSASQMRLTTRSIGETRIVDQYMLAGAATAIDAARVSCARIR
ncbi:MAG: invasion associated locus B family protein [Erythrobacter sp.]